MDSRDLTAEQCLECRERVVQGTRFLAAMQSRMQAQGFPLTDELYVAVRRTLHEAQILVKLLSDLSLPKAPPPLLAPLPKFGLGPHPGATGRE